MPQEIAERFVVMDVSARRYWCSYDGKEWWSGNIVEASKLESYGEATVIGRALLKSTPYLVLQIDKIFLTH